MGEQVDDSGCTRARLNRRRLMGGLAGLAGAGLASAWVVPAAAGGITSAAKDVAGEVGAGAQALAIGVEAYVWGYPLVVMRRTMLLQTQTGGVPINGFANAHALATPQDRSVVLPNIDTLYSLAWLDLRGGPLVLHVPDTHGRYYVLQMLDMYTNTFANIGKRVTGTLEGRFLISGPDWHGAVPMNMKPVTAPTNTVWIIGRTLVNGEADVPNVVALQNQYTLTPLSTYLGTPTAATPIPTPAATGTSGSPQDVASAGIEFYDELGMALVGNPPPADQASLLQRFGKVGIGPGRTPSTQVDDLAVRAALAAAPAAGDQLMTKIAKAAGKPANGWTVDLHTGTYDEHFLLRALTAKNGLGANVPAEAVYAIARVDAAGQTLSGAHAYRLSFAAGQLPPVDAFWSLTLYGTDLFLVANPINRYAITDRTAGLQRTANGGLDIYIQHEAPAGHEANWLPAPAGEFLLVLRAYNPKPPILDGSYTIPQVRQIG